MKRRLLLGVLAVATATMLSACGDVVVMKKDDLMEVISANSSVNSAIESTDEKTESLESSASEKTESKVEETKSDTASTTSSKPKKSDESNASSSKNTLSSSAKSETDKKEKNSKEKAKKIAFSDAGVNEADVYGLEIDLDREKNATKYEVDFKANGKEYEYDIDVYSGKILLKKVEKDDDYVASSSKKPTTDTKNELISKADAKSEALLDAGVKESDIRDYEIELDNENKTKVYEIEFNALKTEYKYEIDAQNGKILHKEIDKD